MLRPSPENKSVENSTQNLAIPKKIDNLKLKKLVTEAFDATREAKDRDIILVIGSTGSGKSTAINYLLGSQMESKRMPKTGKPYIVVREGDKEYAKIGHENKSETLYPEIFVSKDLLFSYCDCPGFEDNRGLEYPICAAIATKAVINTVKSIKAIIIVIEQSAFTEQRGRGFVSVFKALQELLLNNASKINPLTAKDLADSLLFLVTKSDPKLDNVEFVKEFKESADKGYLETHNSDEATMSYMCDLILQNENNIINVNPVDNGKSRSYIIDHLLKKKPVEKNQFNFPADVNTKKELLDLMNQIAVSGIQILRDLDEKPAEIERIIIEMIAKKNNTPDCNIKLYELSYRSIFEKNEVNTIKKLINNKKTKIEANRLEIKKWEEKENIIMPFITKGPIVLSTFDSVKKLYRSGKAMLVNETIKDNNEIATLEIQMIQLEEKERKRQLQIESINRDKAVAEERIKRMVAEISLAEKALANAEKSGIDERDSFELVKIIVSRIEEFNSPTIFEFLALYEKLGILLEVSASSTALASLGYDPRLLSGTRSNSLSAHTAGNLENSSFFIDNKSMRFTG